MAIVQRTSHAGEWVGPVVGRRAELDAARQLLGDLSNGAAHLVFEGPAGIGKSTVWAAAVGLAKSEGATVLVSRPATGDAALPWAGLSDLLGSVAPDAIGELPEPQRRAVEVALARREPETAPLDELGVRLGTLAILQALATDRPVVVAIDDVQWLDAATAGVLAFALKRVEPARVGLVAAQRVAAGDPLADAESGEGLSSALLGALHDSGLTKVRVGPLDDDALRAVVRDHVDAGASSSVVDDICRVSGGNPLYAIELARSGDLRAATGIRSVVEARLAALPERCRDIAVAVAVAGPIAWPDLQALVVDPVTDRDLDHVVRAGFLATRAGRIAFSHPLLEAIVHEAASEPTRQRLHEAYAARFPDSDETPRHLAAATTSPDPDVARLLDAAADRARRRGAPRVAADLYTEAARLTPADDSDALARREIEAALASFAAGDAAVARGLLESVAERGGSRRAEALQRLAGVIWAAEGDRAGMEAFQRALPDAADDPAIQGDIHDNLAWLVCWAGDMPRAYEHVQTAREIAERLGDPALLARVLDKYGQIEFQTGRSTGLEASARAIEYEASIGPAGEATLNRLVILMWSDRLVEARESLEAELVRARAEGNVRLRQDLINVLGITEYRAGNWTLARKWIDEAFDYGVAFGFGTEGIRRTGALVDVAEGNSEAALATVAEMLPRARQNGDAWAVIRYLAIAGGAHLAREDASAAADALDESWALCEQVGVEEPGIFRVGGDAVEAMVAAGRLDRAEEVLEGFERQSRAVDRPWGIASATRGRALLEAARGNLPAALERANEAVRLSESLGQPIELGRALLVAGTIARRAGRRSEARAHLGLAVETFEQLGAYVWRARAEAELGRISGRAPSTGGLTPTEARVAALVAEGLANQEVAARLFVTVRTVETNLTRIYQKLGVRSRTQLARKVDTTAGGDRKETVGAGTS
jgi:DNA-binding CsgD family transcriptional regulator/Tfp pilus assembly protein PilF